MKRAGRAKPPQDMVQRLALTKAQRVARDETLPVLGADTAVVVDDALLGKPADRAEGLCDADAAVRSHARCLHGGCAGARLRDPKCDCRARSCRFARSAPTEAEAYWASGEPRDKAGGYGIQGIGGIFAERIEGSYSGIVGLPLAETEALLQAFGVDTWQYRDA